MCGINGVFAYGDSAPLVDICEIRRVREHMVARGPDAKGEWVDTDRRLGFGHRRLSIIDLDRRADQPMQLADGSLVVVFNGEIYNFRELRRQLEQEGCRFRTQSDTEVLLHLYRQDGEDMVRRLRGMFAFAIWDQSNGELFLGRDPYGIKPLYYADDGKTFRFASQVKALVAGGAVATGADSAGWAGFFLFGSVPEPYTTFKAIRALRAASHLTVTRDGPQRIKGYHSIAAAFRQAQTESALEDTKPGALQEQVRVALLDSVRHHLVADVPIGAFLSGGIDSGALVGLMRDAGQTDIQTVTLAFEEFSGSANDEAAIAAEVAQTYATRHTKRVVTENEFREELPNIMTAMDQPTIDGVNTWFVSKATHELGLKVAISGLGGDELFGSYPSFRDIPRLVRWLTPFNRVPSLAQGLRRSLSTLDVTRLGVSPKMAGLAELGGTYAGAYLLRRGLFMPWELGQIMGPDLAREGLKELSPLELIEKTLAPDPGPPFAKVAALESSLYMRNQLLRDADWTSMAHSLEVRVPLVDTHLLQTLGPMSESLARHPGKSLLWKSPSQPLPEIITTRKKTGFTVPIDSWMKKMVKPKGEAKQFSLPARQHWSRRWAMMVFDHPLHS